MMTRLEYIAASIAALKSPDLATRDAAVHTLERLGGREAWRALSEFTDPTEEWLTEYAHRVAVELRTHP